MALATIERRAAPATLALLLAALTACDGGPSGPDPTGRWTFDPAASFEASRLAVEANLEERGATGARDVVLAALRDAFDAAEVHYEFAADGTFTGTRRQPNPATGARFERDEAGTWSVDPARVDEGGLSILVRDPASGAEERRVGTLAKDRLTMRVRQGAGDVEFVLRRSEG